MTMIRNTKTSFGTLDVLFGGFLSLISGVKLKMLIFSETFKGCIMM